MRVPRKRIYRALIHRGMIRADQVPEIEARLSRDTVAQKQLTEFWSREKGNRFPRIVMLGEWLWERREIIMQILGIAIMFLEVSPKLEPEPAPEPAPEPEPGPALRKPTAYKTK